MDNVAIAPETGRMLTKYALPLNGSDPREAYSLVDAELQLDGNARRNLATFCATWTEPEVYALMRNAMETNLIDRDEYPRAAAIEKRCVHIIADLWNMPGGSECIGCSTSGSSEAALLAGLAMLHRWRMRYPTTGGRPNIVTGPVQACWHKFARYFDVELREAPMDGESLLPTAEKIMSLCDESTIGVVSTLGITFTGQYEDVAGVCAALDQLETRTAIDIPVHVDAASGGFLAPFVAPELEWDFRLARVKSINASGHKFGLAPLGVGWAVWRDEAELPEDLIFRVNYLGGAMPDFALYFSRPAGAVIAQYYNFIRLGRSGYHELHQACHDIAFRVAGAIAELGPFKIIHEGATNGIPAVSWTIRHGAGSNFGLFDLADRLRSRGWLVPAYSLPPNREDLVVQRVVIRQGFTEDMGNLLIEDIGAALEHFNHHALGTSMTAFETAGFEHSGR